ncbi:hypothetical protein [Cupriavidus sp. H18C1]|uniref:hypothetical protein n=1 Tax=Cupriavidus sp. H18C1 TaxID=3241601 RepID=UPI003BB85617
MAFQQRAKQIARVRAGIPLPFLFQRCEYLVQGEAVGARFERDARFAGAGLH